MCPGSGAAYQGMLPPRVSGVGPSPLIGVCTYWRSLDLVPRRPAAYQGACPPGVSVSVPSPLIWVRTSPALGECWGCLS